MDARFLPYNIHLQDPGSFQGLDPHLSALKPLKYVHSPALLQQSAPTTPGIYTLSGGCLTGKTTLLKLWIAKLLADGIPGDAIAFFAAELLKNHEDLLHLLQSHLKNKSSDIAQYIFIDNISSLRNWDKAIKSASETGLLDHAIVLLTSSDMTIRERIQRRTDGQDNAGKMDFQLHPLTFYETVRLKHSHSQIGDIDLFNEFDAYLLHGGYLTAMNDIAIHGKVLDETFKMYSDRLRKEVLMHGKKEEFFHEIAAAIIEHYCKPITWNMLSLELSINHPKTVGDYIALLESLDAVFVQSALLEEQLKGAPKKARKLMFTDPFISHAIRAWLRPPHQKKELKSALDDPELCSNLVKACAITHYSRYYPTYHIKAEGEIDLAYVYDQRFWPVLITWTNLLRTKDLKQMLKYPNGKILTKASRSGIIEHLRTEPLPQALWRLDQLWQRKQS